MVIRYEVSIPNGKPILFRRLTRKPLDAGLRSFNPKREAHPLQTHQRLRQRAEAGIVSIPNGKPILFRLRDLDRAYANFFRVSIPNGKPILFRPHPDRASCRPSLVSIPNGKPILFRLGVWRVTAEYNFEVSIPNGKPILFRPSTRCSGATLISCFNPKREAHPLQTQRPSSSIARWRSFNPKREAHPLQTPKPAPAMAPLSSFNPKREAHPLQTH